MPDPFAFKSAPPRSPLDASPLGDASTPPVILNCKRCTNRCQRSALEPHDWVHSDDVAVFSGDALVSASKYDHAADPDVIDVSWTE